MLFVFAALPESIKISQVYNLPISARNARHVYLARLSSLLCFAMAVSSFARLAVLTFIALSPTDTIFPPFQGTLPAKSECERLVIGSHRLVLQACNSSEGALSISAAHRGLITPFLKIYIFNFYPITLLNIRPCLKYGCTYEVYPLTQSVS